MTKYKWTKRLKNWLLLLKIDLSRGQVVQRLMQAFSVIEYKVAMQSMPRLLHHLVVMGVDLFPLDAAPEPLHKMLSRTRPRPSILMRTPFYSSRLVNSTLVN